MTGFCLKCKVVRDMRDPRPVTLKSGRPATQGACHVCGTTMFKIGPHPPGPAALER